MLTVEKLKKLKDKIRYILEGFPETRNSDTKLIVQFLDEFHPEALCHSPLAIKIECMKSLNLNFESIRRMRQKIQQHDNGLAPTSWQVAKTRGWNKEIWGRVMSKKPITMEVDCHGQYRF